jgi:hypothetical protein
MPIIYQYAQRLYHNGGLEDHYSTTYTLEQAPINEFATVQMTSLLVTSDIAYGNVAFARIRIRQPDNSDRIEDFPDMDNFDNVTSFERRNVTSITFGITGGRSICSMLLNLLDWVD